jgi:beta-lactamase class A
MCYNRHESQRGKVVARRRGCIIWLIIIIALGTLFLAWRYADFRLASQTLPAGMTIAGLPVEGLSREQALNALEVAFATPINIAYKDQRLLLPPESVDLHYDAEQTAANLDAALGAQQGLGGFIQHVMDPEQTPTEVSATIGYSAQALDEFLANIAAQHDQEARPAVAIPENLSIRPGQPGYQLDIEASRRSIAQALVSADNPEQTIPLIIHETAAPSDHMMALHQLIQYLLDDHPGLIPGVFVKDLRTGDELTINAEVAYAGMSVLKIAVMEESYRNLELPLNAETSDWLSDTMGTASSNYKANLLLSNVIADGDGYQGAARLTEGMQRLGLVNTFMTAPYDEEESPHTIVTPANSRSDFDARPDPRMQTTPLDIGLLLEMIYQCSRGGGALLALYPNELSATECTQMIDWMRQNRIDSMIEAGLPVDTPIAHKHGFSNDTHADAGVIFSPGSDFVLTIFLHRPDYLEWGESAPLTSNIATAAYNYFNPAQ